LVYAIGRGRRVGQNRKNPLGLCFGQEDKALTPKIIYFQEIGSRVVRDTGIGKPVQQETNRRISAWHGLAIILTCVVAIFVLAAVSTTAAASSWLVSTYAKQSLPASLKLWNNEIYVIDADGSNERTLTQNPADDSSPAWSLDGRKIFFLSDREGTPSIYVMNADGSNPTKIAEGDSFRLFWSPDARKIFFGAIGGVYGMNADGSAPTLIGDGSFFSNPVWSPDGKKAAFERYSGGIAILDAARSNMTGIIAHGKHPSWSPDGKRIVFDSERPSVEINIAPSERRSDIYIVDADGSNLIRLTKVPPLYWARYPAWSPNGKRIAFSKADGSVYIIDASGTSEVRLTGQSIGPDGGNPTWSPDGKKIAFWDSEGRTHIVDVETRGEIILAMGSTLPWSADSKKIEAFYKDRKIYVKDVVSGSETVLANGGNPVLSPDGKRIAFVKAIMNDTTSSLAGSWTSLAVIPSTMWNSALAWDGGDNIYAYSGTINQYGPYRSDTDRQFYRFSISGNSWSPIAAIPDNNAQPRGLIWLAGEGLYTFDNGKDVWFYHPSSASWKRVTPFPGKNYISSIGVTRAGNKYIYVHDEDSFWQYSVSNDSWETVAEGLWCPPNPTAMVWTGGDFIYGFSASSQESGERAFWRYSISSNQWSALPMPPGQVAVSEKVHLAWGGSDYIYLYGGGSRTTPHLWRYSMLGDTWEALEPFPEDQVAAMVATSSGVYVAPGGVYSELLDGAPSWFYFSPSPSPISVPGVPQELRMISVHLYGQKTQVTVDEDVILELSAINLITNPTMTVQLILQVPPGMSVTSTAFVEAGAGQYTATYAVEPGYARQIEVHIRANQSGSFNIVGYLAYYLGVDKSTAEYRTVNMPVKVATEKASVEKQTTESSRKGIGFLSCSAPAEGAQQPPSVRELLAGWFPIGLTWGCLGICYGIVKRRRRKNPLRRFFS